MENRTQEGLVERVSVSTSRTVGLQGKYLNYGSFMCVTTRRLAFAPFAIGLAILVHIKRQRLAPMESWVGKGVTWLDADYETLAKTKATSERKLEIKPENSAQTSDR